MNKLLLSFLFLAFAFVSHAQDQREFSYTEGDTIPSTAEMD